MPPAIAPLQLAYIMVFSLTALACFGAIAPARDRIDDPDTRWGLLSLLATSGLWASFHVGRLLAPTPPLKIIFYMLGLTTGLATIGCWLYFCSAYTNESYHHQSAYRWGALLVFGAIVAVKLTNPLHGLYFSTTTDLAPFPHLVINLHVMHWIVTGLAYALSAIGFYMLFDCFADSHHATRRLYLLVALAGLPVVFDLIGYIHPGAIITLNYEPIGVGLFAIGVLYFADGRFVAVQIFGREQLFDELDDAIVLLDADNIIQDANDAAIELYPTLAGATGRPLDDVVPRLPADLAFDATQVIERAGDEATRYYLLSSVRLAAGQTAVGRALVLTDITDVERQRRQLTQQRDQLDDFAEAITHELRNNVGIVQGYLDVAETRLDPDGDPAVREAVETAADSADRMTDIVTDLAMLARLGRPVEEPTSVDVAGLAWAAWREVAPDGGTGDGYELSIEADVTVIGDEARVGRLFENLFRFVLATGANSVEVVQTGGELVVMGDGESLSEREVEGAFTYGEAVPDAETGMMLPVVRTLAEAHGWEVTVDPGYEEGVCLRLTV